MRESERVTTSARRQIAASYHGAREVHGEESSRRIIVNSSKVWRCRAARRRRVDTSSRIELLCAARCPWLYLPVKTRISPFFASVTQTPATSPIAENSFRPETRDSLSLSRIGTATRALCAPWEHFVSRAILTPATRSFRETRDTWKFSRLSRYSSSQCCARSCYSTKISRRKFIFEQPHTRFGTAGTLC